MSSLQIPLDHYTDQDFLKVFREDLANSTQRVIILSPFVSKNRATDYYAVLRSLLLREVTVEVYTKPKSEQPISLQNHFDDVKHNLMNIGAKFLVRPGMHEKVGAIDNKILWHGSLNILSHNDTRESMLRLESSELVCEILRDLELVSNIAKIAKNTSKCPECNSQMHLFENAGMWICENSPTCPGTSPASTFEEQSSSKYSNSVTLKLSCPLCGASLTISKGVFQQVACSSHNCNFSLDPRISRGLLRVIRRRAV